MVQKWSMNAFIFSFIQQSPMNNYWTSLSKKYCEEYIWNLLTAVLSITWKSPHQNSAKFMNDAQ